MALRGPGGGGRGGGAGGRGSGGARPRRWAAGGLRLQLRPRVRRRPAEPAGGATLDAGAVGGVLPWRHGLALPPERGSQVPSAHGVRVLLYRWRVRVPAPVGRERRGRQPVRGVGGQTGAALQAVHRGEIRVRRQHLVQRRGGGPLSAVVRTRTPPFGAAPPTTAATSPPPPTPPPRRTTRSSRHPPPRAAPRPPPRRKRRQRSTTPLARRPAARTSPSCRPARRTTSGSAPRSPSRTAGTAPRTRAPTPRSRRG